MTDYGKPQDTPFARKIGLVKPDMIERVAMAMYSSTGVEFGLQEEWKDLHDKTKDEWRHLARATIAAMREPSRAMIEAGDKLMDSEYVWTAMIDAALEDE